MQRNRCLRGGAELLLLLCAAAGGTGCGSHRQKIFAYRLPNYPLAAGAPAAAADPNGPAPASRRDYRGPTRRSPRLFPATSYHRSRRRNSFRRSQRAGREARNRPFRRTPRHARRRRYGYGHRRSRPMDLNQISLSQLEQIPGLTPALAARIIAARPFRSKRTLLLRGYLPRAAYDQAKSYLVVHRADRMRRRQR
jgi:hypothetical protein